MARTKHYEDGGQIYHVTTRTVDQSFWLRSPEEKRRILSALDFYRRRGDFRLFGFVVMDNHVHTVIQPAAGIALGDIMQNLKTWTSRANREKPAGTVLWERRYDDNVVQSFRELRGVLDYIHANPVRAGIVSAPEDYSWSSVHNYRTDGREIIPVDVDW